MTIAPTWNTYWVDRLTRGDGLSGGDEFWCFDLVPSSSPTGAGSLIRDTDGASTPLCSTVDDVEIVDALTTDLC